MKNTRLYKITGILFILLALGFNTFFTLLSVNFEYPDILRSPTGNILLAKPDGGSQSVPA